MPYDILGDLETLEFEAGASSDNDCVILTLDNIVMFLGNVELENYTAGSELFALGDQMVPKDVIKKPVCVDDDIAVLTIDANGSASLSESVATGTLYLNGVCFNVCDAYYNSEIGNNFPQGTSPLR